MKFGKVQLGKSPQHFMFGGTGSSSWVATKTGRFGTTFDRLTYRPFQGAHRGYFYRLPWNKGKLEEFLEAIDHKGVGGRREAINLIKN